MFESWSELRAGAVRLADGFDAALWAPADAARLLADVAAVKNIAATVEGALAARVAESGAWRHAGATSAEQHVAKLTGTTPAHAAGVIETARRLTELPETAAAAARGELSPQQASLVAAAATLNPEAEGHLLGQIEKMSVGELRTECARVRATVEDMDARHARIHAKRSLKTWTDDDGAGHLHYTDTVDRLATVVAALTARRDRLFTAARKEGRREGFDAYMADALHGLASDDGSWAGPNRKQRRAFAHAKVIVRVDAPAYERGHIVEGEICEIVGYGPVPVSVVHEMVEKGGAFAAAVLTQGREVLTVAHVGRRPTALQQTALEWMDPLCAVEGCNNIWRLEVDHRHDWAKTKLTTLRWLDKLCPLHHRLKTLHGWALVPGRGKRAFVPPDDPRHPNNQPELVGTAGDRPRSAAAEVVEAISANARAQREQRHQRSVTTKPAPASVTPTLPAATIEQLGFTAAPSEFTRENTDQPEAANWQAAVPHAANGRAGAPEADANRRAAAPEAAANDPPEP